MRLRGVGLGREHRAPFAVRDGHGDAASGHALEEDGRRLKHLERAEARLELLGCVAPEGWPVRRAGNDVFELAQHLAAVAHAEREGVLAVEELLEHRLEARIEEDRAGPAGAGAQDVAVGEAAAGDEALEIGEVNASGEEVGHVHVHALEARERERRRHLDMPVDPLFAEDGHAGFR